MSSFRKRIREDKTKNGNLIRVSQIRKKKLTAMPGGQLLRCMV